MMHLFAKGLAPPVHIFGGVVSESRAGRKRRRLPPHARRLLPCGKNHEDVRCRTEVSTLSRPNRCIK